MKAWPSNFNCWFQLTLNSTHFKIIRKSLLQFITQASITMVLLFTQTSLIRMPFSTLLLVCWSQNKFTVPRKEKEKKTDTDEFLGFVKGRWTKYTSWIWWMYNSYVHEFASQLATVLYATVYKLSRLLNTKCNCGDLCYHNFTCVWPELNHSLITGNNVIQDIQIPL